jgi:transcriptional regulator with XRE-family HTH domain
MKLISARITSLREYKDLSQADFADLVGIEQSYVSKLERGRAPNVSGVVLARIASVLETSTDYLLNLTDNPAAVPTANHPAMHDPRFQDLAALWPDLTPDFKRIIVEFARKDKAYNLKMRQQEHPDHSNHF